MSSEKDPLAGIKPIPVGELMKKIAEDNKERERKKNAAPEMPTGTCVICGGQVVAKQEQKTHRDGPFVLGGPPPKRYWKMHGYHRTKCGLKYEFVPPNQSCQPVGR